MRRKRDRLQIFIRGVEVLRWLCSDTVSRADAVAAGINYREFYRWIAGFRRLGLRIERIKEHGQPPCYTASRLEWMGLINDDKEITIKKNRRKKTKRSGRTQPRPGRQAARR